MSNSANYRFCSESCHMEQDEHRVVLPRKNVVLTSKVDFKSCKEFNKVRENLSLTFISFIDHVCHFLHYFKKHITQSYPRKMDLGSCVFPPFGWATLLNSSPWCPAREPAAAPGRTGRTLICFLDHPSNDLATIRFVSPVSPVSPEISGIYLYKSNYVKCIKPKTGG